MLVYTDEVLEKIPQRKKDANKGTYGHVLVIAGSRGMSGAAYFSALSAYKVGAGLVRIFTVEENRIILQTMLPEAIITIYEPDNYVKTLKEVLSWATAIVIGPGMGEGEMAQKITEQVLASSLLPMVVDADALNIVAKKKMSVLFGKNMVITPHLGEMSRLVGMSIDEIKRDKLAVARKYALNHQVHVLLKSEETLVVSPSGEEYKNTSGSPALAKAGSGDVLSGVIVGLFCLGYNIFSAASLGTYIHGKSGEVAAKKYGEHSTIARDIIENISCVMKKEN